MVVFTTGDSRAVEDIVVGTDDDDAAGDERVAADDERVAVSGT